MYSRYQPYPYYRRYYNIDPYYYRRYYTPYNIYNSQISDVNQNITNFGDMNDVIQNSDVYQLMAEPVGVTTEVLPKSLDESQEPSPGGMCEPAPEPLPEESGPSPAIPFPI